MQTHQICINCIRNCHFQKALNCLFLKLSFILKNFA